MTKSKVRWVLATAVLAAVALDGCSLLLDTESLKGGKAGTGGTSGAGGTAGTGGGAGTGGTSGSGGTAGTGGGAGTGATGGSAGTGGTAGGTGGTAGTGGAAGTGATGGSAGTGGTAGGTGGTGGEPPDASVDAWEPDASGGASGGPHEAGKPCSTDVDCDDNALCTLDKCVLSECRNTAFYGLGIVDVAGDAGVTEEVIQTPVDSIGPPTLTTDGANFFLGYWYQDVPSTVSVNAAAVVRFGVDSSATPVWRQLKSADAGFDDVLSSPTIVWSQTYPTFVTVVLVGTQTGFSGIWSRTLAADTLVPQPTNGTRLLEPSIFIGNPTLFPSGAENALRVLLLGGRAVMTFTYNGKLHSWESPFNPPVIYGPDAGQVTASAFEVRNAVTIAGLGLAGNKGDYGALVAQSGDGGVGFSLWTRHVSYQLASLSGSGFASLGLAATTLADNHSLIAWSSDTPQGPELRVSTASCTSTAGCAEVPLSDGGTAVNPGMYPSLASTQLAAYPNDVGIGVAQVLVQTSSSGSPVSAVLASVFSSNPAAPAEPSKFNPPVLLVAGPVDTADAGAASSPYGRTAIAIAKNGDIMVAWVEKVTSSTKHVLKARRYTTQMCP